MTVQLTNPEVKRFITEQVQAGRFTSVEEAVEAAVERMRFITEQAHAGHFKSAEEVVEAAVERMMLEPAELDAETVAAIARADEQYDRGEFVEWSEVRDDLRKRYTSK